MPEPDTHSEFDQFPNDTIKMVTALSTREDPIDAALQVADRLRVLLKDEIEGPPDLLMVFATIHHARRMGMIADTLRERLSSRHMLGVTASGIMSGATEVEDGPGLSVLACRFPSVTINPFWIDHLSPNESTETRAAGLAERIGATEDMRATLFFADPFSVPLVKLIPALSASRMQIVTPSGRTDHVGTIIGGMASAGTRPNTNTLLLDGEVRNSGAMGVTLSGPIQVDTVVSQGCRPIAKPMVITRARGNLILELAGNRAVDQIRDVVQSLPDDDKRLLSNGLMLGRVINENKSHFGRGDFLIRSIMGGDETSGAVAVADLVQAGQTIQLHLHDEKTAREDISLLLDGQRLYSKPAGALMISCTGRGKEFFGENGHDAAAITHAFDQAPDGATLAKSGTQVDPDAGIPVAGFFAAGEIGPVDDEIFQHGHTAVVGIFREPEPEIDDYNPE
jgi:small ligand-binding sensory domain FIST